MLYVRCVGLAKNAVYPQTPLSSQATRSHPGKAKSYELKALNETMWGERNVSLFHTLNTGLHQFLPSFQPKRKNGDVRKGGNPQGEQEKINKGKNRRKVNRKQIN